MGADSGVAEAATTGLNGLLVNINAVFTSALNWAGTVGTTIVGNPLLLIGCVVSFIGLGVGLFKRLLHV